MKQNKVLIVAVVLLVASIGGNIFFYLKYKHTQDNDPNIQTQRIVDMLKKTTEVPNETPSVLTVVDKSKLSDSQIAKNAENGDKILLFQKSGIVYVYRPSTNKLINILNLSNPSTSSGTDSSKSTPSTTAQ